MLDCLEQVTGGIDLDMNANKTLFVCFKQESIFTLSGRPLKFVDKFTHTHTHTHTYIYIYVYIYTQSRTHFSPLLIISIGSNSSWRRKIIGLGVRVFANGPGDLGSIPGRVIPKTQKMVLDASLLNTQHYKVQIKGKVEQSRERISALPYTLV